MSHAFLADSSFWLFFLAVDRDLAEKTRLEDCPHCRAPLHRADYPRKPRGALCELPPGFDRRHSFSCSRDGCRKRTTPPSVRFLGSKVYLGIVVALVTAVRQGPTPPGMRKLRRTFGVDRRTIHRWREFWLERFPGSRFWREMKARLTPVPEPIDLPRALWLFFEVESPTGGFEGARRFLEFLSPLTRPPAYRALSCTVGQGAPVVA